MKAIKASADFRLYTEQSGSQCQAPPPSHRAVLLDQLDEQRVLRLCPGPETNQPNPTHQPTNPMLDLSMSWTRVFHL